MRRAALMKLGSPIMRNSARWARRGLRCGMSVGRSKRFTGHHLSRFVVPEPSLARLVAMGWPVSAACRVACWLGELSQQPMCPRSAQRRRCNHHPSAARHSRQPVPLGVETGLMPRSMGAMLFLLGLGCRCNGIQLRESAGPCRCRLRLPQTYPPPLD